MGLLSDRLKPKAGEVQAAVAQPQQPMFGGKLAGLKTKLSGQPADDSKLTPNLPREYQAEPGEAAPKPKFKLNLAKNQAQAPPDTAIIKAWPKNGLLCSVCYAQGISEPQVQTPSGDTCKFGHGGAAGVEPAKARPVRLFPDENPAQASAEFDDQIRFDTLPSGCQVVTIGCALSIAKNYNSFKGECTVTLEATKADLAHAKWWVRQQALFQVDSLMAEVGANEKAAK
jgi:hypothetical protein